MPKVTELGYLGLRVRDLDAWKRFATEVVGAELLDEGEGDRVYLRLDRWHHRIVLHSADSDGLAYMGWRVAGEVEFEEMAAHLKQASVAFRLATRAEANERRVLGLLKLEDPGGIQVEIFYGPQVDRHKPFHPGRPMFGRFVTGGLGLGHCLVGQGDAEAARRFYRLLGLVGGVEYGVPTPDNQLVELTFMHVNQRHHSIAFGLGPVPTGIQHLMLEYSDMDDVGYAHDLVRARQIPVAMQLGKHANDGALTFYCETPSGWLVELGAGGQEPAAQTEYYRRDVFGHGSEGAGMGVDATGG